MYRENVKEYEDIEYKELFVGDTVVYITAGRLSIGTIMSIGSGKVSVLDNNTKYKSISHIKKQGKMYKIK